MKHTYKIILIVFFILNVFAKDTQEYDNFFYYLENKGIIVGKDISTEELFEILNSNKLYNKKGNIDIELLDKKLKFLFKFKKNEYTKIHKKLQKNSNNKINKEIISYFKNNNDIVSEKQKELKEKDNNGFFSKIINYILELMKF